MRDKIKSWVQGFTIFRSIRMWLFVIIFLLGMTPCLILQVWILSNYEARAVEVRTEEVETQLRALANHLIRYDYLTDPSSELINAELAEFSALYDGRLLVVSDNLKIVKDTYSVSDGKTIVSSDVVNCLINGNGRSASIYDRVDGFIEIVTPIMETAGSEKDDVSVKSGMQSQETGDVIKGVLLASVSTATIDNTLSILSRKALIMELLMILAVFVVSLVSSTLLMRPFKKLSDDISEVKGGYSTDPVTAPQFIETERIADSFNQVLGRMNALDESRNEFVSNVSHELKTPMTSMKVLAESLLSVENPDATTVKEFMNDVKNEVDRENQIITELLTLVRMDRKDSALSIAEVNVNKMVESVLKRVRPLAMKRDIELTMVSEREVVADIDEVKMNMVITNLVENAVKYNRDHGKVRVTINADRFDFTVSVQDTGVGIPQESLDKIYERFYRVDKSRSRDVGGTGLGLSITKNIIIQHHGKIDVRSILGEGSEFTMRIPLIYIEHPTMVYRQRGREKTKALSGAEKMKIISGKRSDTAKEEKSLQKSQKETVSASATQKKEKSTGAGGKKKSAPGKIVGRTKDGREIYLTPDGRKVVRRKQ